jgi:hypothetical protein
MFKEFLLPLTKILEERKDNYTSYARWENREGYVLRCSQTLTIRHGGTTDRAPLAYEDWDICSFRNINLQKSSIVVREDYGGICTNWEEKRSWGIWQLGKEWLSFRARIKKPGLPGYKPGVLSIHTRRLFGLCSWIAIRSFTRCLFQVSIKKE